MRAHAVVLFVVLVMATPTTPLADAQPTEPMLAQGQQLVRRGDYRGGEAFFSAIAEHAGPTVAVRALLLQARAALADGDTDSAETTLQQLLATYPGSDQLGSAYFGLEQVRRASGDCAGAMRALDGYESLAGRASIGPYAALQRAQCAAGLGDWSGELAAARAALGVDGGGPRLTRIEAFERAAEAELKMGHRKGAFDYYNRCLELAGTRAYRAEMLFTTATVAESLGQAELAAERFRAIVVDYADQARAPGALDALDALGLGGTVSPLQAGTVRLQALDYQTAVAMFDQVDGSNADWGAARLARAEALLKLTNEDEARQALRNIADADPLHAGSALLRLGQLDERNGDEPSAEASYLRMVQAAPNRAAEALFHVGFTRYVRGDPTGALAAWQTGLASGPPSPAVQTQLLYWTAKADPAGSTRSVDALTQAAAAAPETFYGLRARAQLNGSLSVASAPSSSTAWMTPTASEIQERADWLAEFQMTPERISQDIQNVPALQRADVLLELGLRAEASWEVEGVLQQYAETNDVAHLSGLADWLSARDQPQLVLRVGRQLRDLVGLSSLPRAVQKDVYPAGWSDLVAEQAARYAVDPLLVLALIRQESSFDMRAQSGAHAMGLTQVVPSTARIIASHLGRDDFAVSDLFKPEVSLEFGTWYLSQMLNHYKGSIFPSLAAYDAGQGNVASWLQRYGDDPDLLVEQIPFAETQSYLRVVYDNYWHYQALYARS